jgi:hypothetical protein
MSEERVDKLGLDRSVLTYVDISCQPVGGFYLIIDESYGKALFSVDEIDVKEHEVVAYRNNAHGSEVVTRFSPLLVWRTVNTKDVYVQPTRTVMEREVGENKDLRAFREQVIKDAGLDKDGSIADGLTPKEVGQYL